MKHLLTIVILTLGYVSLGSTTNHSISYSDKTYKTKHVFILVLDGPRWSETFGDSTCQYVPNLKYKLAPQGVFFNNFTNDGTTNTLSGHSAMTTGIYQKLENTGRKVPKNPSIFQYYLKQHKKDKRKAWVLTSKGKLNVLSHTSNKKWIRQYAPSVYSGTKGSGLGYPSDVLMLPIFQQIIKNNLPDLAIINLLDIDAWAHQGNWDKYIASIVQNDKLVLMFWEFIQKIPQLRGNTTLFITNDHGRHLEGKKNGFISHGDKCEGCKHISLIAIGPDFKVNETIDKPYDLIDITATTCEIMKIDMPTGKGEVMWELFKDDK